MYQRIDRAVQRVFPPEALSIEQTRKLADELRDAYHRKAARAGMAHDLLERINDFEASRHGHHPPGSFSTAQYMLFDFYNNPIVRPFGQMDERAFAEYSKQFVELAGQPYCKIKGTVDALEAQVQSLPFYKAITRDHMARLGNALCEQASHEVKVDLMRMGLAVEAYHKQWGRYPAALDEIEDILGEAVPLDPMSGKAYKYRATRSRFWLYSIGLDGEDDGGATESYYHGDIVWRGKR